MKTTRMALAALLTLALAGCTALAKHIHVQGSTSSGGGGSGYGGSDDRASGAADPLVVMPDIKGLSVEAARAKLKAAGIKFDPDIVDNNSDCDEAKMPIGYVCDQRPQAGEQTYPKTPKTIYTKPVPTAALMPDVLGKTEAQARKILKKAGFNRAEVEIVEPRPHGCKAGRVCRSSPDAGELASFDGLKLLYMGGKTEEGASPDDGDGEEQRDRDDHGDRDDNGDRDDHKKRDDDGDKKKKEPPVEPEKPIF